MTPRSAPAARFRPQPRAAGQAVAQGAPGEALLTYTILPASVPVGSQQLFSLTAKNESGAPVTFQAVNDSITLGALNQLTDNPVSPQNIPTPWEATPNGSSLQFWTLEDVVIDKGESVVFEFSVNVLITPGTALLTVVEIIGGNVAAPPALPVLLQNALSITAFANPSAVGQQRAVTLQWNTIGGEYVTISPGPDTRYDAGTASTLVTPNQNAPQTVYTLTVHQGLQTANTHATVNLCAPEIKSFVLSPGQDLTIKQIVQAAWSTQYATQVTVNPPLDESPFVQASDLRHFDPSRDLPANAMTEPYILTAYGYLGPVQSIVTVDYLPMRIRYLRYATFPTPQDPKPDVIFDVFNAQPGTSLNASSTPILLTAVGPGGPAYAQLGGTGPEVQVMLADPPAVPKGQNTVISYLVANVTALKLRPGDVPLSFDSQGKGTVTVQPDKSTTYILVASNGGVTVTSELDVLVV